jgi:tetratricopeptide (TPR) repeat protein
MSFIQIDPIGWLPDHFKQQIIDSIVTSVTAQAEKAGRGGLGRALKRLRSDAAFQQAVDQGLKEATDRFVREYTVQDEDLVAAITQDPDFWKADSVRQALLEIVRHPDVHLVEEQLTLARSFVDVLRQRVNRERVDRAVSFYMRCVAESLWHLEPLRPIYELQMQRFGVERAAEMVHELRGMRGDVREAMLALVEAIGEQQKLLAAPDRLALSEPKKIYHNLPQSDYGTFIGREKELAQVHRLLRPHPHSRHYIVVIDGIGGIGKSALALEVAHRYLRDYDRLPKEERFDAIIWTSAKSSVLTAEGIAPRRQITRTLDDIYTTISVTLEREDIIRARPVEQNDLVTKALTQQHTLLIVDNLETVDDERVNIFLRELPAPTKAIVTTRHRIDIAYPVRLTGMPEKDGLTLISQECAKKDVMLNQAEAERLYSRTGGVPLAIVWSVAQMGYGYRVESVLRRLSQPSEEITRYCFEGAVERIWGKPAYNLLMALSLFDVDASREALGFVTDLPELDRDDGLVQLEKLSLIDKTGSRFSVLPMTRQFALAHLSSQAEIESEFRKRQAEYYLFFISNYKLSSDSLDLIRKEHSNIATLLDYLVESGEFPIIIDIFRHYYPFLWRQGYWTQGIKLARQVLSWAEVNKREDLQARCNHWLGRLYLYQGQYTYAEERLSYASNQYSKDDWQWISVQTYLAQVLLRQRRFSEAHQILERALPVVLERRDYRGATRIQNAFAEIELSRPRPNLSAALKHIETGYELAEGRNEQTTVLGKNFYLRGIVEYRYGRIEQAKEWIIRYKELAVKEGFIQEAAQGTLELAKIAKQQGAIEEAEKLAEDVKGVFERLGMREELDECENLSG